MTIIFPDRDAQYRDYQEAISADAPIELDRCAMCGYESEDAVRIDNIRFCCEDCIASEMYENSCDRQQAIHNIKNKFIAKNQ